MRKRSKHQRCFHLESLEPRLALTLQAISLADLALVVGTGNGPSGLTYSRQVVSDDGRYVVFESDASDLVANDNNGTRDIFRYDRTADAIELVSVDSSGTDSGNGFSSRPAVTGDGRFVAFDSRATNLISSQVSPWSDVYVRDMQLGITTLVSVAANGIGGGDHSSHGAIISNDGSTVAFSSAATNLSPEDIRTSTDVYARRLLEPSVRLVSKSLTGTGGNSYSTATDISSDGNTVVFHSRSSNLIDNDSNGNFDVFLRDISNNSVALVSESASGTSGNSSSFNGRLSGDGQTIVFYSYASNLVPNDTNRAADVFYRRLSDTALSVVSVSAGGEIGNANSYSPVISDDGETIVFSSHASNLVGNDNNSRADVFLHRVSDGTLSLVSETPQGVSGNGQSIGADVSADGSVVAFRSLATDIVDDNSNSSFYDVFVRDFSRNTTWIASSALPPGEPGNGHAGYPYVSSNGRLVAFWSQASNLTPADNNNGSDVFAFAVADDDFGDAPASYPVTISADGARHANLGPRLGDARDSEADGLSSDHADGDDVDAAPDDEEGVTLGPIVAGINNTITVNVQQAPAGAKLDAWIDYNGDGDWDDTGERIAVNEAMSEGDNTVTFSVPAGAVTSTPTFARFRLSTAGSATPRGLANDGEVEDYELQILGDPTVNLTGDIEVLEGTNGVTSALFHVERSHNFTVGQIDFATLAGSASEGIDYEAQSGTINFAAGGPLIMPVSVNVLGDTTLEEDEQFSIELSNPVNTVLGTTVSATAKITNDDTASVRISSALATQKEGTFGTTTPYEITVELVNPVQGGLLVDLVTEDGSATVANADFAAANQNLSFAGQAGETKSVTVNVNHDAVKEPDEDFLVRVQNPVTTWNDASEIFFPGNPVLLTIENDDMIPPVADAGGPYAMVFGTGITLDASRTFDADGIATFQWDLDDDGQFDDATGESRFLSSAELATIGLGNGTHTIRLLVTDNTGDTDTDSTTLSISPNLLPIAEANGPYTLEGPMRELMISSAGSSDPDGDDMILIPEWDLDGDGVYGDLVGDALGGMAMMPLEELQQFGFSTPGDYVISLRVTDEAGGVGFDDTTLTIANVAPTIFPFDPFPPAEPGFDFSVMASVDDLDDDPFRLNYEWDLNGDGDFSDGGASGESLFVPYSQFVEYGFDDGGTFPISLRVTDPFGGTATATGTYEVVANQPPIADIGGPYELLGPMREVMIDGSNSIDPDGDSFQLTFAWDLDNDGVFDDSDLNVLDFRVSDLAGFGISQVGVFPIAMRVTDVHGKSSTATTTLTIANQAPDSVEIMLPPEPLNPGDILSLSAQATDPDDDISLLTFAWDLNVDGEFGDAVGQFVDLTHGELVNLGMSSGGNLVLLKVSDPFGGSKTVVDFVELTPNIRPIAAPGGPYQLQEMTRDLLLDGSASIDPDGEPGMLIYEWDLDNDGDFDDANGDIVPVPLPELMQLGIDQPGAFPIALRVTDIHGAYGFGNTYVAVSNAPPQAMAGGPYVFEPDPMFEVGLMGSATDADDEAFNLTYEWDFDLDGEFGDAVGEFPLVSFADLTTFGVTLPENTIRLRATDSFGAVGISDATVSVNYPPPIEVTSHLDVIDPSDDAAEIITLREAIKIANEQVGPNVIELPEGVFELTLTGSNEDGNLLGDLDVLDDLVLLGPGPEQTTIDASAVSDRVFHIPFNSRVVMRGISLAGGQLMEDDPAITGDDDGAGIFNAGRLTLSNVVVRDNSTTVGWGGGIYNSNGTVELVSTLVENNSASVAGGGMGGQGNQLVGIQVRDSAIVNNTAGINGGGITAFGQQVTVTNSTVSGNTTTEEPTDPFLAEFYGGAGIWIGEGQPAAIDQTTIADNQSASFGGGIRVSPTSAAVTIENTLIGSNTAPIGVDAFGVLTSSGHNLIGIVDGATTSASIGDQFGTLANPILAKLKLLDDYGGPTPTHLLLADSPALDAGRNMGTAANDQRGLGFPRVFGGAQDIGAAESDDDDGVSSSIENAAPNGGDGNQDGVLDSEQVNVASLPNAGDGSYVTVETPQTTIVSDVSASPIPADAPVGVDFDLGVVDFTVTQVDVGGSTTVTLYVDEQTVVDSYYKFGPTSADPTPHWYEFLFDETSGTGAVINGSQITIHLRDGARGDDDLTENGVIVDPGVPGFDQLPTIDVLVGPDFGLAGDELLFEATVADPGQDDAELAVEWDFGDQSPLVLDELFPTHTYTTPGLYTATLTLTDAVGRSVSSTLDVQIESSTEVVGRHLFYNNSSFDGMTSGPSIEDDNAIAPAPDALADASLGKTPLLPGGMASFQNYSSYVGGINGIMIDVLGLPSTTLSEQDFSFRVGNSNDPASWTEAPTPSSITVRDNAGVNGSDRITTIWPDGAIKNQWLQVQLVPSAANGYLSDEHLWGNQIGETGNVAESAAVNAQDVDVVANNPSGFFDAGLSNPDDFDRDNRVTSMDIDIAANNPTGFFPLVLLDLSNPSTALAASHAAPSWPIRNIDGPIAGGRSTELLARSESPKDQLTSAAEDAKESFAKIVLSAVARVRRLLLQTPRRTIHQEKAYTEAQQVEEAFEEMDWWIPLGGQSV